MHLDEERLQRLHDGELTPGDEAAARDHVAGCLACRQALDEAERAERRTHELLRALDAPAPATDAEAIAARAREPVEPIERARGRDSWERWSRPHPRWRLAPVVAAALLAAVAAFAVPGSPVPGWLREVAERIGPIWRPAALAPTDRAEDGAGIAVVPGANLWVEFTRMASRGSVRVELSDGPELTVRGPSGAATYTWGADRVVVDNRDRSASFVILVPRSAPRVEILIEGVPVFLKEGDRVTLAEPEEPGVYHFPLTR